MVFLRHRLFETSSRIHIKVNWADDRTIIMAVLYTSASAFGCVRNHARVDGGWILIVFHLTKVELIINILFWFKTFNNNKKFVLTILQS